MDKRLAELWYETRDDIRKELYKKYYDIKTYGDLLAIMLGEFAKYLEVEEQEGFFRIVAQEYGSYSGNVLLVYNLDEDDEILDDYTNSGVFICIIDYGSCSGCDTLLHALDEGRIDGVGELMQICLHIIQRSKKLCNLWEEK